MRPVNPEIRLWTGTEERGVKGRQTLTQGLPTRDPGLAAKLEPPPPTTAAHRKYWRVSRLDRRRPALVERRQERHRRTAALRLHKGTLKIPSPK